MKQPFWLEFVAPSIEAALGAVGDAVGSGEVPSEVAAAVGAYLDEEPPEGSALHVTCEGTGAPGNYRVLWTVRTVRSAG